LPWRNATKLREIALSHKHRLQLPMSNILEMYL
jgi:hypothetical protein